MSKRSNCPSSPGEGDAIETRYGTCTQAELSPDRATRWQDRLSPSLDERNEGAGVARVEIGGRRQGQEVWARRIDGHVQGDREFLRVAGLDPGTPFEDPHAFVELIQGLLDPGSGHRRPRRTAEASVTGRNSRVERTLNRLVEPLCRRDPRHPERGFTAAGWLRSRTPPAQARESPREAVPRCRRPLETSAAHEFS
jgi:hypothetical protein